MTKPILVTGAASGLGRFLSRELGGIPFTRQDRLADLARAHSAGFGAIVHCAYRRHQGEPAGDLASLLEDNILFTADLLRLPHDRFVYLSSVDVYPPERRAGGATDEAQGVPIEEASSLYATFKLICEAASRRWGKRTLVLRPSSLIGEGMRENNVTRMLADPAPRLSLTADSELNLVGYDTVAGFLREALRRDAQGIFNLCSASNVRLDEIAAICGSSPRYGSHRYDVGRIRGAKAAALEPRLRLSSREVLLEHRARLDEVMRPISARDRGGGPR